MLRFVAVVFLVGCGADAGVARERLVEDAGQPDSAVDSGAADAGAVELPDASADAAVEVDAQVEPEADAAVRADAAVEVVDAGQDSGTIIVGPGPDDASEPVPYFELACPADPCPERPDPERERFVETDLCYAGSQATTCTFYCVQYVPAEGVRHILPGRSALCEALGGHCRFLDASGDPIPGDQELTDESSYCLPPWAP